MKSGTRAVVRDANRRGGSWQAPASAERLAERSARAVASGSMGSIRASAASSTPRAHAAATELDAGVPLSIAERAPMEAALQADFSGVRVHTQGAAAEAAEDLGARAFAHGSDVAFAPGEYSPQRSASQQLLAHELTHVAQQARAGATGLQFDAKKDKAGVGAAPPDESYIKDPGNWGSEDSHLLFKADQAEPEGGEEAIRQIIDAVKEPSYVHVHGYASAEGPGDYNLNLSAHRAAAISRRLEGLLPQGSKVILFAHGDTRHFGGPDANRRVGISIMGAVADTGFKSTGGLGIQRQPDWVLPGAGVLKSPGLQIDRLPATSVIDTSSKPDLRHPSPGPGTSRSLMDNAALLAPGASHPLRTGSPVESWDATYLKYHKLGVPDKLKLGPIDLGAGALANKEVSSGIQAYHERNDPTLIEQSNSDVGAHIVMSPNLLDLWPDKKKKKGKGDK
jgi:outer membrane protein OmpA-like peptidoglycan-associated protein